MSACRSSRAMVRSSSSRATHLRLVCALVFAGLGSACAASDERAGSESRPLAAANAAANAAARATGSVNTDADASAARREREQASIRAMLDTLYAAFCFDPGGEADWAAQRALFCPGASFVAPIRAGQSPRISDATGFLDDFHEALASSLLTRTGFHERVVHARIDAFGAIAHAYVTFEGFVPPAGIEAAGGPAAAARMRTRGVDSIQLVRDGERWLVASFATQYEDVELPLPARFAPEAGAASR